MIAAGAVTIFSRAWYSFCYCELADLMMRRHYDQAALEDEMICT
jgi:hypothetical protein